MFGWFRARTLDEVLSPTRVIRVHGVRFKIRRLNPMDYLAGSKAMRQLYETMKAADSLADVTIQQTQQKAINDHYIDTFMAAVIEPKLKKSSTPGPTDEEGTPAANLLTDMDFANRLYAQIIEFSYGKKKVASFSFGSAS
jgi:hypothetical protein